MKQIITLLALTTLLTPIKIFAEERVDHYEATNITSSEQALTILNTLDKTIETTLTSEKPEFESIHKASYSLENAIDTLIKEKSYPENQLSAVDEAVQALHHASENHEDAKTREWSEKLGTALASLDDTTTETATAKTEHTIVIKNHKFTPEILHVPAGEKIKLIVDNQDPTPEEFESDDLRREKIITGNSKATVYVGPMKPGKYHFFGEFNLDTANGYIIAE